MRLLLLLLTFISFLFSEERELEKIRNSLAVFEKIRVVEFVFYEQDDYLKMKGIEENQDIEKILKENPEFSGNDNEIFYFNSYWEYKKDLAKLAAIDNSINKAGKKISTEERNYLKTYLNLLKANVWLLFKKKQGRKIDKSIFFVLSEIIPPLPRSKSTLNKEYLEEYYAFYGEINSILAKIENNFIVNLFTRNIYSLEAEIFFFKSTSFPQKNNRGLLLYILNGLFFKKGDYFFIYSVKKQLKNILKSSKDKETLFIINIVLANLYYEKNDLAQSWRHIQLAKQNKSTDTVADNMINLLEKNFLTRKPTLINL